MCCKSPLHHPESENVPQKLLSVPLKGRTEGGRRFYTESDMIQLEHIIFYRGLGFSLNYNNPRNAPRFPRLPWLALWENR